MFKTAVITDEISQDMRTAVALAKKYGLDGVEIRSVGEKGPHELTAADIRDIKLLIADAGLSTCAIAAPFYKCAIGDEAEVLAHHDILRRCADLAHALGTSIVRGFTFWKKGPFMTVLPRIVSRFEIPARIAEARDIILALEHDDNVSASNARMLREVIQRVDSPHVRGLWDPGNVVGDPDGERVFPESYEILKPLMAHMHLKDSKRMPDGTVVAAPLGGGDIDYRPIFRRLIADDYRGFVSLETHYRIAKDIGVELRALPKGSAFSLGGAEATEECLRWWVRLLRELSVPGTAKEN